MGSSNKEDLGAVVTPLDDMMRKIDCNSSSDSRHVRNLQDCVYNVKQFQGLLIWDVSPFQKFVAYPKFIKLRPASQVNQGLQNVVCDSM